jgi:hypothetical protein
MEAAGSTLQADAGYVAPPAVVCRLDRGVGQRLGDGLLGAAAAATQYALGGFFLSLAIGVSGVVGAHTDAVGRLLAGSLALAVYAFGRWGRQKVRCATTSDVGMIVEADCLVIRHDALLAAPAVIPREAVTVVAIDTVARASDKHSLPVAAERGERRLTWFWERFSGASVPVLGSPLRAPNLVLLFDRPIDFAPKASATQGRRRAHPGPAEGGLLLRVEDAPAAKRAFFEWDSLRALTAEDLARKRPLSPSRPRLPYAV